MVINIYSGGINATGEIELFDKKSKNWTVVTKTKEISLFWSFQAVSLNNATYIMGGIHCERASTTDACIFPSTTRDVLKMRHDGKFNLEKFPQSLLKTRFYAGSIVIRNSIILAGGWNDDLGPGEGDAQLEYWDLIEENKFNITAGNYTTSYWDTFPLLFEY